MIYRPYAQADQTRIFTQKYSRSKIPYRTAKKMRELYPDGRFVIIGEIGNFAKTAQDQDMLLTAAANAISIFPRGSLRAPFEWIAGYIAVGENTYIAVVKCLFPSFLRLRKQK